MHDYVGEVTGLYSYGYSRSFAGSVLTIRGVESSISGDLGRMRFPLSPHTKLPVVPRSCDFPDR